MLSDTVKQIFYKHQNNCFPFRNLDSIFYRNLVINFCFDFLFWCFSFQRNRQHGLLLLLFLKNQQYCHILIIKKHLPDSLIFNDIKFCWSNLGQGFSENKKKIPFMNISIIFSTNNENRSYGKSFAQHHSRKKIYCVYQVLRNTCSKMRAFHCKIIDILGKYFMGKCRIGPWYGKT